MAIHFANISGGVIYHEPQQVLQEPFDRNYADRGGAVFVMTITASGDTVFSGSFDNSGSLNQRRAPERRLYDNSLLATRTIGSGGGTVSVSSTASHVIYSTVETNKGEGAGLPGGPWNLATVFSSYLAGDLTHIKFRRAAHEGDSLYNTGSIWIHVTGCIDYGNDLAQNTAPGVWGAVGAFSYMGIPTSYGGFVQFTTAENNTDKLLGLSTTDDDLSYTSIDFAIYLKGTGDVAVLENNSDKGNVSTYVANDIFKIVATGSSVTYYKNGSLIYTSLNTPTYPLYADVAMFTSGSSINDVVLSASIPSRIVELWKDGTLLAWGTSSNEVQSGQSWVTVALETAYPAVSGTFYTASYRGYGYSHVSESAHSYPDLAYPLYAHKSQRFSAPTAPTFDVGGTAYFVDPVLSVVTASSVSTDQIGYPPSWTQHFIGLSHGFVMPTLSSSAHESQILNAYLSGTEKLENTVVAASGAVYYSKGRKLRTLLYTLTASSNLTSSFGSDPFSYQAFTGLNHSFNNTISGTNADESGTGLIDNYNGIGTWVNNGPSQIEQAGRSKYVPLSGNYIQNTIDFPAHFKINVPERGRIVDVKVWVEFIHDIRGGRGPITGSAYASMITNGSGEYSSNTDTTRPNVRNGAFLRGLGSVVLALRSPNVKFDYCHPLWNSMFYGKKWWQALFGWQEDYDQYHGPEIYKNSYLLWGGHTADFDLSGSLRAQGGDGSNGLGTEVSRNPFYAEFDSDIDMRTIFTDSSRWINPRNLMPLYPNRSDTDPGVALGLQSMTGSATGSFTGSLGSPLRKYRLFRGENVVRTPGGGNVYTEKYNNDRYIYGSPSYHAFQMFGISGSDGVVLPIPITGANIPWFMDTRIPTGDLRRLYSGLTGTVGFFDMHMKNNFNNPASHWESSYDTSYMQTPPRGWLNGAGNYTIGNTTVPTTASGEFQTFGLQIGPPDMQPVYPLLDDVVVEKMTVEPTSSDFNDPSVNGAVFGMFNPAFEKIKVTGKKYQGYRPGLRGTEINGEWDLMIAVAAHRGYDNVHCIRGSGIWFRQWRLELTVEENEDNVFPNSRRALYRQHTSPQEKHLVGIVSGSAGAWDMGINYVYTVPRSNDYGRTSGITDNTGSNLTDFAVFTRLTGALADRLTGSGQAALYSYLHNEFGTPYIPVSSGSNNAPSFFVFDAGESGLSRRFISDLLEQKTLLKRSNTLQSVLSRNSYLNDTLARRRQILVDLDVSEGASVFTATSKLPS